MKLRVSTILTQLWILLLNFSLQRNHLHHDFPLVNNNIFTYDRSQNLEKREELSLIQAEKRIAALNLNVSPNTQRLFDSLNLL